MTISPTYLTPEQRSIVNAPLSGRTFLSGPAGSGKTTAGVERLLNLLENGIPGNQVLLMVPQRTLAAPYKHALQSTRAPAGGNVDILTVGGLAKRMVDLFWPLVAEEAGFQNPENPPVFLTMETAQYYMAHLVRPTFDEGYFDAVTLDRNRLYSQLLDDLNKAAINGFPHTEVAERLSAAWIGEQAQRRVYADVQDCLNRFRTYCLTYNLLDFSLQLETFLKELWPFPLFQEYLNDGYRHLIFDNLEEDTPITADLLADWLPELDSALLIFDQGGGFRRFLGAAPHRTGDLAECCDQMVTFESDFVAGERVKSFRAALEYQFTQSAIDPFPTAIGAGLGVEAGMTEQSNDNKGDQPGTSSAENIPKPPSLDTVPILFPQPPIRFYPDMLDWVAEQVAMIVDQGTPPGEVVILAPYLSDALRYSLVDRLDRLNIPSQSHRPSRALREEPAAGCLLTLAKIAHPQWELQPQTADFAYALMQSIAELDLIRAQLLAELVYRGGKLASFEEIKPEVQSRVTFLFGNRYETLRNWLQEYIDGEPQELDHFLSRLFGEVLSQPGFGFHGDYNAGGVAANLVESVMKFRRVAGHPLQVEGIPLGKEYLQMVEDGVIAAQYLSRWETMPEDAVFLAPAYTFLMANRPVDYQVWLNVGGRGWHERLYQPLTHPYVLSRDWPPEQPWTDSLEKQASQIMLQRLTLGLLHRCRRGIILGISKLNEGGFEHKGELLKVIDQAIRS